MTQHDPPQQTLASSVPVHRVLDLVDPATQQLGDLSLDEARARLLDADPEGVLEIAGSFALIARDGERVCLARSLDRPLRYFLAKEEAGPMLIVAERIDEIRACLEEHGYGGQFHPTYTRMVPAHHVTQLRLIGCPDPNPVYRRFFAPERASGPADLDALGAAYVGALCAELRDWLLAVPKEEPLGILFSGGLDSGAVLLCLYQQLLELGHSPARLKAFTLSVDGGGEDVAQARAFLRRVDLEFLLEPVEVTAADLDPLEAVAVIEDYKPLDVECATVQLAMVRALRQRYPAERTPSWTYLVDGDGGDENLKDYPIEENAELTIRSVVNNSMLYQEGWGVEAIKHSLTFSGGYSRGCVRTFAPARRYGFVGFSPYTRPRLIEAAEAIPFAELTGGDHGKLYALKGEILSRGVAALTGHELPVFEKRRFQHGAAPEAVWRRLFDVDPKVYRRHFLSLYA